MAHVEKRGPRKYLAVYRGPDGRERSQTFEVLSVHVGSAGEGPPVN